MTERQERSALGAIFAAGLVMVIVAWGRAVSVEAGDGRAIAAQVVRVIDGDTLDVRIGALSPGGDPVPLELRVRLIGIDTPETNSWNDDPPEPCAMEAKAHLASALPEGSTVRLIPDPRRDRGRYNRHLFYVETTGPGGETVDAGLSLLQAGLAREVNFEDTPYLRRAAYEAADRGEVTC